MNNQKLKKADKPKVLINFRENTILLDTFVNEWIPGFYIYHKKDGSLQYTDEYISPSSTYVPLSGDSSYIKSGSLIFPSDLIPYGTVEVLLEEIRVYLYKYCDVSPVFSRILPYYVLMTYIYENFYEIPYLRVIGDYGSGKSRFLRVIGNICYSPIMVNWWASVSAIFRMIEITKWTLILDEADFQYSDTTNEIIKLLNNWFAKWNPILRADGENFEPRAYDVFCPKIIGWRMEFRDKATESRCIVEVMKRTHRKDIPLNLSDEFSNESEILRNKLYKFRYDYQNKIKIQEERIEWLEWRLNQILNPILSIIKSVGKQEDYDNIIAYFRGRQKEMKEDRKFSIEGMIFTIIQEKESKKMENIYYSHILLDLKDIDITSNMNPRKLWSLLKQYEIKTIRRNDGFVVPIRENRERLDVVYKTFDLDFKIENRDIDDVLN